VKWGAEQAWRSPEQVVGNSRHAPVNNLTKRHVCLLVQSN